MSKNKCERRLLSETKEVDIRALLMKYLHNGLQFLILRINWGEEDLKEIGMGILKIYVSINL